MKAWIFDFDGTIVDTGKASMTAFREALEPFGVEFTAETMELIRHEHPHRVFRSLVGEENEKKVFEFLVRNNRKYLEQVELFHEIFEAIEYLKAQDRKVAIWTGRDLNSMTEILDRFDLHHYFDDKVSGTCVEKNKPDPEGLLLLSDRLSVEPHEMIMIGDHAHDVHGAGEVGARAIQVHWQNEYHKGETHHEPHHEFHTPDEFHNFVKKLFEEEN